MQPKPNAQQVAAATRMQVSKGRALGKVTDNWLSGYKG